MAATTLGRRCAGTTACASGVQKAKAFLQEQALKQKQKQNNRPAVENKTQMINRWILLSLVFGPPPSAIFLILNLEPCSIVVLQNPEERRS